MQTLSLTVSFPLSSTLNIVYLNQPQSVKDKLISLIDNTASISQHPTSDTLPELEETASKAAFYLHLAKTKRFSCSQWEARVLFKLKTRLRGSYINLPKITRFPYPKTSGLPTLLFPLVLPTTTVMLFQNSCCGFSHLHFNHGAKYKYIPNVPPLTLSLREWNTCPMLSIGL